MQEFPPEEALDLRQYGRVLWVRKWTVIWVTLLVVGATVGFSLQQTPQYTAEARLLVKPIPQPPTSTGTPIVPEVNLQTEREVLSSVPVAERVKRRVGLEASPEELLEDLEVEALVETEVLRVSYTSPDPSLSRDAAQAFAEGYIDYRRDRALEELLAAQQALQNQVERVQGRLAELEDEIADAELAGDDELVASLEGRRTSLIARLGVLEQRVQDVQPDRLVQMGAGEVIEPAELPTSPSSPDYVRNGVLALVLGLLAGVGLAFLRDRLDDRFRGRQDVEQALGAPVVATIPRFKVPRVGGALVTLSDPRSQASEEYRSLRTNLQFLAARRDARSIAITSGVAEEGKTLTSANLAVAFAQAGQKTVIVSADLRRPSLERLFGVKNRAGVSTWLTAQDQDLESLIQPTKVDGLGVVASGPVPPNPSELLSSPRLRELVTGLEEWADFVIIDCPPVLPVTDAVILANQAAGAVMVVNASQGHRSASVHAKDELERVGAQIVGVVLNAYDPSRSPYDYYAYSHYYREYKQRSPEAEALPNGYTRRERRGARRLGRVRRAAR